MENWLNDKKLADLCDVLAGCDLTPHEAADQIGAEDSFLLVMSAEDQDLVFAYEDKEGNELLTLTPKGARPFGGLTDEALEELHKHGWVEK